MKQAMIFAAGMGTRLRPLTDRMPKALVPVGGEPLLRRVVARLRGAGVERMVVNVHHFASQITDYLVRNANFGLDIRVSDETAALLETGGGIRHARPLLDAASPVLVHNVDVLSNADLASLLAAATVGGEGGAPEADATLLVSQRKTRRYLVFGEDMRLVGWTNIETGEVRSPHEWVAGELRHPGSGPERVRLLAFSGIHVLSPRLIADMEAWPERFPIMDFYLDVCARRRIAGHEQPGLRLMDVGKLDTLAAAEDFLDEIGQRDVI